MGYMTDGLTFRTLRDANLKRIPLFKDKFGNLCHPHPEGKDWSPAQWLQAVVGELGEYANFRKKFDRGDMTEEEFKIEAAKELADVQIYLDILAFQVGVDLGKATMEKWNETSKKLNIPLRIDADDWHYTEQQMQKWHCSQSGRMTAEVLAKTREEAIEIYCKQTHGVCVNVQAQSLGVVINNQVGNHLTPIRQIPLTPTDKQQWGVNHQCVENMFGNCHICGGRMEGQ